ncbi:hypothetical protein BC828DRAFT_344779 [Blastocladiella britannica]|nr:hypothetical protein BC828DRAFT_344779 [Blastocladiella britannica]
MSAGAQSVGGQSVATAAATVAEPAPAPAAPAPPAVVYVTAADVDAKRESVSKTDPAGQTEFAKWLLREAARLPDAPSSHDLKHKMFDEAMAGVRRQAEGYGSGAARNGWPEAQFFLAECYRKGAFGTSKNLDKAYALYTKASKAGHSPATYYRGLCCELGHGTKVNETKALTMFRTAAQAGVTAAALKLGVIYQRGLLRQKPNEANALLWLKRAAADVNTAAQVVAATEAGETGGDEAATPEAASRMAAMASRNVYALHACWLLGLHYEKGRAGDDHEKGFQFFLDAAELGYAPAMFKVGMCLRDGVGIDRNPAEATEWFAAAAAAGVGSLGEITNLPLPV